MQEHSSQVLGNAYPVCLADRADYAAMSRIRLGAVEPRDGHSVAQLGHLVAASASMRAVFAMLNRLAVSEMNLTLVGETGAGKDVLANAIHARSRRKNGPFVVFDCGAVAENLAESELFGHERGSFTGAAASHVGAFERASGGTLFLDEIGELPLALQPRLLRVLENRCVRRVGGTQDRQVDVRVVAATNRDLPAEVCSGRFRQDLFFRLAGAVVPVPPLRNRLEDLPYLVQHLLEGLGRSDVRIAEQTLAAMKRHTWPGNVRELKNALAYALAFLDGHTLEPHHLRLSAGTPNAGDVGRDLSLYGMTLQGLERAAIEQTLFRMNGNKSNAARALGIPVPALYEKLKKHGL